MKLSPALACLGFSAVNASDPKASDPKDVLPLMIASRAHSSFRSLRSRVNQEVGGNMCNGVTLTSDTVLTEDIDCSGGFVAGSPTVEGQNFVFDLRLGFDLDCNNFNIILPTPPPPSADPRNPYVPGEGTHVVAGPGSRVQRCHFRGGNTGVYYPEPLPSLSERRKNRPFRVTDSSFETIQFGIGAYTTFSTANAVLRKVVMSDIFFTGVFWLPAQSGLLKIRRLSLNGREDFTEGVWVGQGQLDIARSDFTDTKIGVYFSVPNGGDIQMTAVVSNVDITNVKFDGIRAQLLHEPDPVPVGPPSLDISISGVAISDAGRAAVYIQTTSEATIAASITDSDVGGANGFIFDTGFEDETDGKVSVDITGTTVSEARQHGVSAKGGVTVVNIQDSQLCAGDASHIEAAQGANVYLNGNVACESDLLGFGDYAPGTFHGDCDQMCPVM